MKLCGLKHNLICSKNSTQCLLQPPDVLPSTLENWLCSAGDPTEQLVDHTRSNIELRRKDMACMAPLQWLNDEVMNLYMALLQERDMRARSKVGQDSWPARVEHELLAYLGWEGLKVSSVRDARGQKACKPRRVAYLRAGQWYEKSGSWVRAVRVQPEQAPAGYLLCMCRARCPSATSSAPSSSTSSTRTPATTTTM